MAKYVQRAEKLKPKVLACNFNAQQLNVIHQMMRGCTMLRQGKVISSFFQLMMPDGYELREGPEVQSYRGPWRPLYVVEKGSEIDPVALENDAAEAEEE